MRSTARMRLPAATCRLDRGSGEIVKEKLVDYDTPAPATTISSPRNSRLVAIEPYVYPVAGTEQLIMSFGVPITVPRNFSVRQASMLADRHQHPRLGMKPFARRCVAVSNTGIRRCASRCDPDRQGPAGRRLLLATSPRRATPRAKVDTDTPPGVDRQPGPDRHAFPGRGAEISGRWSPPFRSQPSSHRHEAIWASSPSR